MLARPEPGGPIDIYDYSAGRVGSRRLFELHDAVAKLLLLFVAKAPLRCTCRV